MIDPFGERQIGEPSYSKRQLLKAMEPQGDRRLRYPGTERTVDSLPDLQCAQSIPISGIDTIHVSCITRDNLLEFDFKGRVGDFAAFVDVAQQAERIQQTHPGVIVR